jgi:hypothetical protein
VFFFSWDISCGLQENFDAQLEKNCLLWWPRCILAESDLI